jgi:hypothetical protein
MGNLPKRKYERAFPVHVDAEKTTLDCPKCKLDGRTNKLMTHRGAFWCSRGVCDYMLSEAIGILFKRKKK